MFLVIVDEGSGLNDRGHSILKRIDHAALINSDGSI